ncbi:MAG: hypothetical protein U5K99_04305 [Anaerolineales bacterium]|nr:hypothetical protein [Anaerolineales bacterium]
MNVAKAALFIIMTLLAIIIFFSLTGLDVKDPMPAVIRIIDWTAELNRTVNSFIQEVVLTIQTRISAMFP